MLDHTSAFLLLTRCIYRLAIEYLGLFLHFIAMYLCMHVISFVYGDYVDA